jgi:hypothetical protein
MASVGLDRPHALRVSERVGPEHDQRRDPAGRRLPRGQQLAVGVADDHAVLGPGRIEGINRERERLDDAIADLDAPLAEWDGRDAADEALDWWNDFSAAIRGEVVNAKSVRAANTALRERFASIFVRSPKGLLPRLDFVLKEREPGAPLVSSRLWADDEEPDEG